MPEPTYYSKILVKELEKVGIKAKVEYDDEHKHVDIHISEADLDIEVDGTHHHYDPEQARIDLLRTRFSLKQGRKTIRIPNNLIYHNPSLTASIIKEIVDDIKEAKKKKITKKTTIGEIITKKMKEELLEELRKEIEPIKKKQKRKNGMILSLLIILLFIFLAYLFLTSINADKKVCDCDYDRYSCSREDFSNKREAQECFEYCGGVDNDIHYLDGDRDGYACEIFD